MSNIAAPSISTTVGTAPTSTPLKTIDGLDPTETTVKEINLEVDREYKANIKNTCLAVYISKQDKKTISVTKKEVKDDIQISIKLGKYKGFINHKVNASLSQKSGIYLAFENVKDNSEYLLIKSDDILSITAEDEPSVPSSSNVSASVAETPDNLSTSAVVGQQGFQTPGDDTSTIASNETILDESESNKAFVGPVANNQLNRLATLDKNMYNPKNVDNRAAAALSNSEFDGGQQGGKRRTAKRSGASKKRVSKKEKKTRKVKRAGRKA